MTGHNLVKQRVATPDVCHSGANRADQLQIWKVLCCMFRHLVKLKGKLKSPTFYPPLTEVSRYRLVPVRMVEGDLLLQCCAAFTMHMSDIQLLLGFRSRMSPCGTCTQEAAP